ALRHPAPSHDDARGVGVGAGGVLPTLLRGVLLEQHAGRAGAAGGVGVATADQGALVAGPVEADAVAVRLPPGQDKLGPVEVGAVVVLPTLLRRVLLIQLAGCAGATEYVGTATGDHGVLVEGGVAGHTAGLHPAPRQHRLTEESVL